MKPMNSQASKSDLLKQLTIEEQDDNEGHFAVWHLIIVGILCAIISGALVYFLVGQSESAPAPALEKAAKSKSESTAQSSKPNTSIPNSEESSQEGSEEVLNASGYITARLIATVSAETMGLIQSVEVEEGMQVEKGQVLAKLDDTIPRVNYDLSKARLNAQRARLSSAETDLKEAKRVLQRILTLKESDYSSQAQLTRAEADVEKLTAQAQSMRADMEVAKLDLQRQLELLQDFVIRAPFAGVVTVKNAQPGEIVAPAAAGGGFTRTGICTIVDMNSLEIEVDVNEAFIRRVYPNQKVIAKLDAYPSWEVPAKVIAIIPAADRSKATVRVRIAIETKDDRILPDMGVKVAFYN